MKAIVQDEYGPPEVLQLRDIDTPGIKDHEVLLRVRAAAVHPGDLFLMEGVPYVFRVGFGLRGPRRKVPGFDVAGIVEAVGASVEALRPGDEVFGNGKGTCAELTAASEGELAPKPAGLTFEQAAAVPTSAVAALRGIRDAGKVRPGQKVLIEGSWCSSKGGEEGGRRRPVSDPVAAPAASSRERRKSSEVIQDQLGSPEPDTI